MNTYYVGTIPVTDEIYHHGILGQKWGIRRYQNTDGSLTDDGFKRYYGHPRKIQKDLNRLEQEYAYVKGDEYRNRATYDRINAKTLKRYKKLTGRDDLFDGTTDDMTKRFQESGLRDTKGWAKIVNKQNKAIAGMDEAQKKQAEIESDTWRLMGTAMNQNYSVITSPKYRNTVRAGEQWLTTGFLPLFGGAIGGAVAGGAQAAINMYRYGGADHLKTKTNKHKVINDGRKEAKLVVPI